MELQIQKHIVKQFTRRNILLRPDAVNFLKSMFVNLPKDEWMTKLDKLLAGIPASKLNGMPLDKDKLLDVASDAMVFTNEGQTAAVDALIVRDAFELPRLQLHQTKRVYMPDERPREGVFAGPNARAEAFRGRYNLTYQRLRRHKMFSQQSVTGSLSNQAQALQLTSVGTLKNSKGSHFVMGMLTEIEEGHLYLEDPGGFVPVDWSTAVATPGFYTQNSIVLVEGQMVGGTLKAHVIGYPPPERVEDSQAAFTGPDFHGERLGTREFLRLEAQEKAAEDAMIVVLAEVHLDNPKVMDRLKRLFAGYEGAAGGEGEEDSESPPPVVPTAFVLMGSFFSRRMTGDHRGDGSVIMRQSFDELAYMLREFPRLCERSHFVFVPGPNDPGVYSILPRPAIPETFTRSLREVLQRPHFVSNPCRLQLFTQRMVVFREDLMLHMLRRRLPIPEQEQVPESDPPAGPSQSQRSAEAASSNPQRLVTTLLSQSHLYPLPTSAHPVAWALDPALYMYPLPDVLILGDTAPPFDQEFSGCQCANPSAFGAPMAHFYVYYPSKREFEESTLPDEES